MFDELNKKLKGKNILLLGVGNRLRGDDAVGSLLIDRLRDKVDIPMIDAGDVPENYLGPIEEAGADVVLIVDATDMGANAGDVSIFDIEQVQNMSVSTHTANLGLLFKAIPPEKRPEVILLGIQPGNLDLGQGLSEPVLATLVWIEKFIQGFDKRSPDDEADLS
jgi:hydrogenase 3 maturation protease